MAGCTGRRPKPTCVVFQVYKTDLEKDIISDTSGDFRKLMVALAKVSFPFMSLSLLLPKASHIPHFILGHKLIQSSVPASESPTAFPTNGGFVLSLKSYHFCTIGFLIQQHHYVR